MTIRRLSDLCQNHGRSRTSC